jgi:hypothetical protein
MWELVTGTGPAGVRIMWHSADDALRDRAIDGWKIEGPFRMCPKWIAEISCRLSDHALEASRITSTSRASRPRYLVWVCDFIPQQRKGILNCAHVPNAGSMIDRDRLAE